MLYFEYALLDFDFNFGFMCVRKGMRLNRNNLKLLNVLFELDWRHNRCNR